MNNFQCNRCGYKSKIKGNFVRHLDFNSCNATLNDISCLKQLEQILSEKIKNKIYNCEICNKTFTNRSSKCRHQKNCKEQHDQKIQELEQNKQEIQDLKNKLNQLLENQQHINITNNNNNNVTNNNINITNNIQILSLDDVNYSFLKDDPEKLKKFLNTVLSKTYPLQVYDEIINELFFNLEHPENHSVRKINKKAPFIEIFNGEKFEKFPHKEGVDKIIEIANKTLVESLIFLDNEDTLNLFFDFTVNIKPYSIKPKIPFLLKHAHAIRFPEEEIDEFELLDLVKMKNKREKRKETINFIVDSISTKSSKLKLRLKNKN